MDKMKLESADIISKNIKKIAELFPNCITETEDENGNLKKAINFDILKQDLSKDLVKGKECYEFTWVGKKESIIEANRPIRKTLRPCKKDSVNWDTTENLYIEGDNLEVLKLLQESYLGKVKMIYIDPPYNTGNDFIYPDDYKMTDSEFNRSSDYFDEDGNIKFSRTNSESEGKYHSDWCSMIYSRLMIARNLLSDDGVIFISIDDNEQENLKKITTEIFGENCFIADLIWQKKFSRSNDATYFSTMHDHILCLCKKNILQDKVGWKIGLLPRGNEIPDGYSNPDNDPRGVWASVILSAKSGSESLLYPITTPSGKQVLPPSGRYWSCSKETFIKWREDNRIWFGVNGDSAPRKKTFLSEAQKGLRPNTILFQKEFGNNQDAKQETKLLFNGISVFDGPKPVNLLKNLIKIANLSSNDLVLDFFSGSATTAHAVMQLNAEDGGNRKFIMVQLPEPCDEKSEAFKAGYKNICEIGKERIRRAAKKIAEDNPNAKFDGGFRVFKVDDSNMKDVYYAPSEYSQSLLDKLESNIKEDRTDLDLFFGCILDWGLPLNLSYTSETIENCSVHTYSDNALIACFNDNIPESVIKEIAKRKPLRVVFRDSSFADTPSKINVTEIFKLLSPDTRVKVI